MGFVGASSFSTGLRRVATVFHPFGVFLGSRLWLIDEVARLRTRVDWIFLVQLVVADGLGRVWRLGMPPHGQDAHATCA
jgi:hypothetical protein